jgi:putative sterol carrier protein
MAINQDTRDLTELAQIDPDSILDRLNDTIARRMPTYRELYLRWERLNWSVADLDFSADRADWLALDSHHRDRLLWTLAAFYVAEQRVAATLTPYVTAAPLIEQKIFLTTQCVDETRHAIFFDRWFHEVIAAGDGDLAKRLKSSRQWVGPGFAPLFDEYLEDVTSKLRDDPTDLRHFAKSMAVYHLVIEGVLALTGQKFILAWARNEGILPGFRAGFTAVARDESRHVAFGVRVLRDLLQQDPSLIGAIHEGIAETLALGSYLYQPPGGDVTYTSAFGYTLGDLFNYGGIQLEKKMRAIGAPMPSVEISVPAIDAHWPPPGGGLIAVTTADRISTTALRALGRVAPRFSAGMAVMMLHLAFRPGETRGVDTVFELALSGPGGGRFTIHVDDGVCRVSIGGGQRPPDVVYSMAASTWLEMAEGRATGDEALLLGKLHIVGDPSLARRFNDYFAPVGEPPTTMIRPAHARGPLPIRVGNRIARTILRRSRAA